MREFHIQAQRANDEQPQQYTVTIVPVEQDGPGEMFSCPDDSAFAGLLSDLGFGGEEVAAILEDLKADGAGVNLRRQVEEEVAEQLGCGLWTPGFEPWNEHHSDPKLTEEEYQEILAHNRAGQQD